VPLVEKIANSPDKPHEYLSTTENPYQEVSELKFSLDGATLAASLKKTQYSTFPDGVILWDVIGNRPFGIPQRSNDDIEAPRRFTFSPDGTTLAASSRLGVVQWRVPGHGPLSDPRVLTGGPVSCVAYSTDGKNLAAGFSDGPDGRVVLWELSSEQSPKKSSVLTKDFGSPKFGVDCESMDFSHDGNLLVAGFALKQVPDVRHRAVLWDLSKRGAPRELCEVDGGAGGVAFPPDNDRLLAGVRDGVAIYLTKSSSGYGPGFPLGNLEISGHGPTCLRVSGDGATLAVGSDHGVALWDIIKDSYPLGRAQHVIELGGSVQSIAFDPGGTTLAVGVYGRIVRCDIGGRRRLKRTTAIARNCGSPLSLGFCPNGMEMASNYNDSVAYWHVAEGDEPGPPVVFSDGSNPRRLAISSDCCRLAAAFAKAGEYGTDYRVVMFDLSGRSAPREAWNLELHENSVFSAYSGPSFVFSPDGKKLALARAGALEFLSAKDGNSLGKSLKIAEVPGVGRVRSLAFNHTGTKLAVGYDYSFRESKGAVLLLDMSSGKALGPPLVSLETAPGSLAFDPDETLLAMGCINSVVLFDLAERRQLREPLILTEGLLTALAFSPDGSTLTTGYADSKGRGGVLLWDMDLPSWQRRAKELVGRNLSWDEWQKFFGTDVASYQRTFLDLPDGAGVAKARQAQQATRSGNPPELGQAGQRD
jgi:WD40 repeat protein